MANRLVTGTLVLDDPAAAAAGRLAAAARAGAHVALAGGATPRTAYERAAAMEAVDWSGCTLWFGDERCVAPDDERSNARMVEEALLARLAGDRPAVRRIPAERGPHEAADAYEAQLREAFSAGSPSLDLVLLGLGADGHCASLFPGQTALEERRRLAIGVERPGLAPWVPRVTLSLPAINAASEVVFLVAGADKAEAVARAFAGGRDLGVPASLVAPAGGGPTVLLDAAAAAELPAGARS